MASMAISVTDLSKKYEAGLAVSHATFEVPTGTICGFVGPNGAGKTTLMRTLTGEIAPSAGKLVTGVTVKAAFLTQHLDELDPTW